MTDATTNLDALTYGPMQIALLDIASGQSRLLGLFPAGKHINPQFSPDGRDLYFLADPHGFTEEQHRYSYPVRLRQEAGYRTGHFGKWHLGDNYPFRAEDRGFSEVLRHGGGGIGQTPDYWNNSYFDDTYNPARTTVHGSSATRPTSRGLATRVAMDPIVPPGTDRTEIADTAPLPNNRTSWASTCRWTSRSS